MTWRAFGSLMTLALALGSAGPSRAAAESGSEARKKTVKTAQKRQAAKLAAAPARPSRGQKEGLKETGDPLALKSSVALVIDQETNEVLFSKNPRAVLPIASITKLMTALVVVEAKQSLDETLTVSQADIDLQKNSGSRLAVGTQMTRGDMLRLALMSSENRAANALGRHYPGGMDAFVARMNRVAQELQMTDTRFTEPTGLSSGNESSAKDLAVLVKASFDHELIREYSTAPDHLFAVGKRKMQFRSSNALIRSADWDIGLQKTGYISEAGRCVVMQAEMAGRKLIMVLLDSAGKYSRIADAERLRKWVTDNAATAVVPAMPAVLREFAR